MKNLKCAAMLVALGLLHPQITLADELGRAEYMNTCATCHGASAAGDGPLAEFLTVPVPSLTGLSKANDGVFPMLDVIYTVDGRQGTRGHGYPMPVWGDRYETELGVEGSLGNEALVRSRILSIALYLESIQEE